MKRYALFFVFISIQTNIALAAGIKEIKEYLEYEVPYPRLDKSTVVKKFGEHFDKLVFSPGLTLEQRNAAFALKCGCLEKMTNYLFSLDGKDLSSKDAKAAVYKQLELCITEFAELQDLKLSPEECTAIRNKIRRQEDIENRVEGFPYLYLLEDNSIIEKLLKGKFAKK